VCLQADNTQALISPPSLQGAAAHLHLKGHTTLHVFAHPQKGAILTCYKNDLWDILS